LAVVVAALVVLELRQLIQFPEVAAQELAQPLQAQEFFTLAVVVAGLMVGQHLDWEIQVVAMAVLALLFLQQVQ
jgi:hypothetical protein